MELIICIKMDLALNNLQEFICHKTCSIVKEEKYSWILLLVKQYNPEYIQYSQYIFNIYNIRHKNVMPGVAI